jgi:hypothetical protein
MANYRTDKIWLIKYNFDSLNDFKKLLDEDCSLAMLEDLCTVIEQEWLFQWEKKFTKNKEKSAPKLEILNLLYPWLINRCYQ